MYPHTYIYICVIYVYRHTIYSVKISFLFPLTHALRLFDWSEAKSWVNVIFDAFVKAKCAIGPIVVI